MVLSHETDSSEIRLNDDSKLSTVTGMISSDDDDSVLGNGESLVINPFGELFDASKRLGTISPDVVDGTSSSSAEGNNGRNKSKVNKDITSSNKSVIHVFILLQWLVELLLTAVNGW